jgi:hypothetical protein
VDFLRARHGDDWSRIGAWYGVSVRSRRDALAAAFAHPPRSRIVLEDEMLFLERIAGMYFRTVSAVIRRHDPNHLYLGDRFAGGPEEDTPLGVIHAAAPYVDVFSVRKWSGWFPADFLRPFHQAAGGPVMVCETGGQFDGAVEADSTGRYARWLQAAFARRNYIVGWQYHRLIDAALPLEPAQQGLVDASGVSRAAVTDALRWANARVWEWASHGAGTPARAVRTRAGRAEQ